MSTYTYTRTITRREKLRLALERLAKVAAAAAVAVVIKDLPEIGALVPFGFYGVGAATALLSSLEKYLRA